MEMTLNDLLTVSGLAVVVTILTQLFKGFVDERWVPLFAVAIGITLAVGASVALGLYGVPAVAQAILTGLLGGAAAIGIYTLQQPTGLLKGK